MEQAGGGGRVGSVCLKAQRGPVRPHAVMGVGMQQTLDKDLSNEWDKEIFKWPPPQKNQVYISLGLILLEKIFECSKIYRNVAKVFN